MIEIVSDSENRVFPGASSGGCSGCEGGCGCSAGGGFSCADGTSGVVGGASCARTSGAASNQRSAAASRKRKIPLVFMRLIPGGEHHDCPHHRPTYKPALLTTILSPDFKPVGAGNSSTLRPGVRCSPLARRHSRRNVLTHRKLGGSYSSQLTCAPRRCTGSTVFSPGAPYPKFKGCHDPGPVAQF